MIRGQCESNRDSRQEVFVHDSLNRINLLHQSLHLESSKQGRSFCGDEGKYLQALELFGREKYFSDYILLSLGVFKKN